MRKTLCSIFIMTIASLALGYEFPMKQNPYIVIAGDVEGLVGPEGYNYLFDAPGGRHIFACGSLPVRLEIAYQDESQRQMALAKNGGFLIKIKVTFGAEEFNVSRIRTDDDGDAIIKLKYLLGEITTTGAPEDLEDQVRLTDEFVRGRMLLEFGPAKIVCNDILKRTIKFSRGALAAESQLFRDVWATHLFNLNEMTTTCASSLFFPLPQKKNKKSRIPDEGDPASNN